MQEYNLQRMLDGVDKDNSYMYDLMLNFTVPKGNRIGKNWNVYGFTWYEELLDMLGVTKEYSDFGDARSDGIETYSVNILLHSLKNIRCNFSVKALIQHIYIFIIILLCRAIDKGNICRITLHYGINNILWFIFLRHNRPALLMWIKIIGCMIYTVDLFSVF